MCAANKCVRRVGADRQLAASPPLAVSPNPPSHQDAAYIFQKCFLHKFILYIIRRNPNPNHMSNDKSAVQ